MEIPMTSYGIIYIVHGTRTRLINPDVVFNQRISDDFWKAKVNGMAGLLTTTKIIAHQQVRFFVPETPNQIL